MITHLELIEASWFFHDLLIFPLMGHMIDATELMKKLIPHH